jgi:hypothetical protein
MRPSPLARGRRPAWLRGTTLLEIIVALALVSAAVAGAAGVTMMTARFSTMHGTRLDTQQAARRAFERVTEELRWAERVVADPSCPPFGLCADRVTAAVPAGNPYRRDQPYDVTFLFNRRAAELERRVNRGTNNVAAHVTGFVISYYDAAGRPAATADDVRRLHIALAAAAPGTHTLSWEATVAIRNLRPAPPTPPPTPTPVWRPTPRHRFEPAPVRTPASVPPLVP